MKSKLTIGLIVAILMMTGGFVGVAQGVSGSEILENLDETMRADSKYMEQEMVLVSSRGSERSREIATWSKVEEGSEQMLVRFLAPADVAGTGLLLEDEDMWLFLPELNNTRRIAGSAREGDFMGSDLTYKDMEALGTTGFSNDYDAELLAEKDYDGEEAYHLELQPVTDDISYNKLEMIVSAERWLPLEIKYFEDGEHVKTLLTFDHDMIDDRWTAQRMEMSDHERGTMTKLILNAVDYSGDIDSNIFTVRNLERGQ